MVHRQLEAQVPLLGLGEHLARGVQQVLLDERLADRFAQGLEERVGHRPADQQRVDAGDQVLDDLEFVRHLGTAQDRDERTVG